MPLIRIQAQGALSIIAEGINKAGLSTLYDQTLTNSVGSLVLLVPDAAPGSYTATVTYPDGRQLVLGPRQVGVAKPWSEIIRAESSYTFQDWMASGDPEAVEAYVRTLYGPKGSETGDNDDSDDSDAKPPWGLLLALLIAWKAGS